MTYQTRDRSTSVAAWVKERPVLAASIGIVVVVVAINVWPKKEGRTDSYNTPAVQRSESFDSAGYRSGCDDALYGTYALRDVASWVRTSGVDENQAMVDYVYYKSGYQAGWAQCGSDPVYVPDYPDREP